MQSRAHILLVLSCILPVSLCIAAGVGAYQILPWRIPRVLLFHGDGFEVLIYVRFPRVILSAIVGAILAISGATLQGIFRNPLADPGLIGVTAGAGLGAALWIVLVGGGFLGIWGVPIAAFTGGILVTIGVWKIAQTQESVPTVTLLLAGIALNSFAGAGIGLMTFLADEEQLRSLTFWLLGGFGGATWRAIAVTFPVALIGAVVLFRLARALNAMTLGESEAYHLGVSTESLKRVGGIRGSPERWRCRICCGWDRIRRTHCAASAASYGRCRPSLRLARFGDRRRNSTRVSRPLRENGCYPR